MKKVKRAEVCPSDPERRPHTRVSSRNALGHDDYELLGESKVLVRAFDSCGEYSRDGLSRRLNETVR